MYIAGIRSICIAQTTTVCVGTAQASVVHIAADIGTLVDEDIGVVFIGGQSISKPVVRIAATQRQVNSLWCQWLWSRSLLFF